MKAYTGCESGNVCKARDNTGAKLDSVAGVQTFLANNGFNPGIIDGEMGSYTREAIKAFQRKVDLIPDGVAGTRTKNAMKAYTCLLYTSPSPRDSSPSRMPSSA